MRFHEKYKKFNLQFKNKRLDTPLRILKFKRTKWKVLNFFIQKQKSFNFYLCSKKRINKLKLKKLKTKLIQSNFKFDNSFFSKIDSRLSFNNLKLQVPLKKWERLENVYKHALALKRSYYYLHNFNISYTQLKKFIFRIKQIDKRQQFLCSITQFDFRLDVLLWRLHFFKSTYEARTLINNGSVKVNSLFIKGNYFLQKGDVISFTGNLDYILNLKRLKKRFNEISFIEFDLYTNTIIVLESLENRVVDSFFMKENFNLDLFRYSFR